MSDPTDIGMIIRGALPGEGRALTALMATATDTAPDAMDKIAQRAVEDFAADIDTHGGNIPAPYANTQVLVATTQTHTLVGFAVIHAARTWIEAHPEAERAAITTSLLSLTGIGVKQDHRGQGIGTHLLASAMLHAYKHHSWALIHDIRPGEREVMTWFRRRGWLIAGVGEPVHFAPTPAGRDWVDNQHAHIAVGAIDPVVAKRAIGPPEIGMHITLFVPPEAR